MKDKLLKGEELIDNKQQSAGRLSPLEMIKLHGGKAHRVSKKVARGADAMLAVYKGRFTYTFVMNKEVASIHFDENSRKIFFSGHNINNMPLSGDHKKELMNVINVLDDDDEGKDLKRAYEATLGSQVADNK